MDRLAFFLEASGNLSRIIHKLEQHILDLRDNELRLADIAAVSPLRFWCVSICQKKSVV